MQGRHRGGVIGAWRQRRQCHRFPGDVFILLPVCVCLTPVSNTVLVLVCSTRCFGVRLCSPYRDRLRYGAARSQPPRHCSISLAPSRARLDVGENAHALTFVGLNLIRLSRPCRARSEDVLRRESQHMGDRAGKGSTWHWLDGVRLRRESIATDREQLGLKKEREMVARPMRLLSSI